MSQPSLDSILKTIKESAETTGNQIDSIIQLIDQPLPDIIKDLIPTDKPLENVSLLSLKNNALLSYIDNLSLVILSHLELLQKNGAALDPKAVHNSIIQRVTLERGVKALEKKLTYQLDKMVRSYKRMESEESDAQTKLQKQEDSDQSDDSEEEDNSLSFRPDASSLVQQKSAADSRDSRHSKSESSEKYKPPKIAAVAPPTASNATSKQSKQKLQSMEEYLMETGDTPLAESSIGANILSNGRGGTKTQRERLRESEIQRYEEANFTRLSQSQMKQKNKRTQDNLGGEDFGIFYNNRTDDVKQGSSRKKLGAWERAKRTKRD